MSSLSKEDIISMFCKDMEQPAIQMALYRSFRRYADLRDQLAGQYEEKTGIPASEFTTAYALRSFCKED